jgi:hypothetical protein
MTLFRRLTYAEYRLYKRFKSAARLISFFYFLSCRIAASIKAAIYVYLKGDLYADC